MRNFTGRATFGSERRLHRLLGVAKYPRLLLLVCAIVAGYLLFHYDFFGFGASLNGFGYLGTFVAGALFAYGFTAGVALAFFLSIASEQHILLASVIGGLGAVAGDSVIFSYLRFRCAHELRLLSKERVVAIFSRHVPSPVKRYLLVALGGLVIASPLPDEIGIALLATSRVVSAQVFAYVSFGLNFVGILIVLLVGRAIG